MPTVCIYVSVSMSLCVCECVVWGSGGMKRRVQLELNAPRVNWPILQSQPLECVLSDGTYPLSLSFSSPNFSLSLSFFRSSTRSHTHTHTHTLAWHTPSLSLSPSLSHSTWSLVHSRFHSLSHSAASLCTVSLSLTPRQLLNRSSLLGLPPYSFLPRTSLSCTSFTFYFLPSLTSSLLSSLFLPLWSLSSRRATRQAGGSCSHCA